MIARLAAALAVVLAAPAALADEPRGCDKFKWSVAHEQASLQAPDRPKIESGGAIALDSAVDLSLAPLADAHLPTAPEKAPKSATSMAGLVNAPAPTAAGVYKVTVSAAAWIDVVQDGMAIKSAGFSGALDCPGVRKSVKFALAAKPFVVELSGVDDPDISLIVSPQ